MTATALAILGWTLYAISVFAGVILNMVGLFGNWVILGASAAVWLLTDHFGLWTIIFMLIFAVLGEIAEALAAAYGAKRYGGGKGAMVSAIVGCIIGAIVGSGLLPILGTIAGACIGAFIGPAAYEYSISRRSADDAMRVGFGAALGKVAGMMAKTGAGFLMLLAGAIGF
jgi:uncharacterized protein YqgC (DUF456 family)